MRSKGGLVEHLGPTAGRQRGVRNAKKLRGRVPFKGSITM